MTTLTKDLRTKWAAFEPILMIRDERDYDAAIDRLNDLLDEVGADVRHPLFGLLDTLGTLIHAYEEAHHPMPAVTGAEMLGYLMDEHGLTQADLPEVGSQGVVSELLSGKRELNVRQIRGLVKRFGVAPGVFI
jgi:HTH-type transcriptional regulator/antitoxin HigA